MTSLKRLTTARGDPLPLSDPNLDMEDKVRRPRLSGWLWKLLLLVTLCCVGVIVRSYANTAAKADVGSPRPVPTGTLSASTTPTPPRAAPNDELWLSPSLGSHYDVRLLRYQVYGEYRAQAGCSLDSSGDVVGLAPLSDGYYYCALLRRVPHPTRSAVELLAFRSHDVRAPEARSGQPEEIVMRSATLVLNRTYVGLPSFEISCCWFRNESATEAPQDQVTNQTESPPDCVTDTSDFKPLRVEREYISNLTLNFQVSDPPAQGWECVMTWAVNLIDGCARLTYEDDC